MATATNDRFYLPSLEGLRFIAFFLVFLQHLPRVEFSPWFADFQEKGSIGVDIFLALSAFLLASLIMLEQQRSGRVDFKRYMQRRVLRIAPLLYVYLLLLVLISGYAHDAAAWARIAGNILFVDNFICWIDGYSKITGTAHLWTLSYEMQMYLVIPGLALLGLQKFSALLRFVAGAVLFAVAARAVFVAAGATHPLIWVTPFLRPESVLAGLLLACVIKRAEIGSGYEWAFGIIAAVSLAYFLSLPIPHSGTGAILIYLIVGGLSGGAVWAALRLAPIRAILVFGPIVFLGRISYGLYVYHLIAIYIAAALLQSSRLSFSNALDFVIFAAVSLAISVTLAVVSFFLLERPFLRLKTRFQAVPSRPV